jgi:hypothetical protein
MSVPCVVPRSGVEARDQQYGRHAEQPERGRHVNRYDDVARIHADVRGADASSVSACGRRGMSGASTTAAPAEAAAMNSQAPSKSLLLASVPLPAIATKHAMALGSCQFPSLLTDMKGEIRKPAHW